MNMFGAGIKFTMGFGDTPGKMWDPNHIRYPQQAASILDACLDIEFHAIFTIENVTEKKENNVPYWLVRMNAVKDSGMACILKSIEQRHLYDLTGFDVMWSAQPSVNLFECLLQLNNQLHYLHRFEMMTLDWSKSVKVKEDDAPLSHYITAVKLILSVGSRPELNIDEQKILCQGIMHLTLSVHLLTLDKRYELVRWPQRAIGLIHYKAPPLVLTQARLLIVGVLFHIALTYYQQFSTTAKAQECFQRIVTYSIEHCPFDSFTLSHRYLGEINYSHYEQYEQAVEHFQVSATFYESHSSDDYWELALCNKWLAMVHFKLRLYQLSIDYGLKAIDLLQKPRSSQSTNKFVGNEFAFLKRVTCVQQKNQIAYNEHNNEQALSEMYRLIEDAYDQIHDLDLSLAAYECVLEINQDFSPIYQLETVITESRLEILFNNGGMKAVIWTDVLQAIVIAVGLLAVAIQGLIILGGFKRTFSIASRGGRIEFDSISFDPRTRHTIWSLLIGGSINLLATYGFNQAQVQRYMSIRSTHGTKQALYINAVGSAFVVFFSALIGVIIYAYYADCDPYTRKEIEDIDQILPYFVMEVLSDKKGLPGVFLACIFSGSLSTISSGLNSLSAVIIEDIYKGLLNRQLTDERQEGPIMGVFVLGFLFPRANRRGGLVGFFASLLFLLWIFLGAQITKKQMKNVGLPLSIANCSDTTNTNWTITTTIMSTSLKRDPLIDLYSNNNNEVEMTTTHTDGTNHTNSSAQILNTNSKKLIRSNTVSPVPIVFSTSVPSTVNEAHENSSAN
ncbi:unnamed protein product [Rotaria sordida]|uniref:Uncharacterized protein n=1 Tax=Rotaria sordida TaxID=392033 RepID=A0A818N919_9BILA|nr:unnamed protein product [Rotaria sordida]